MEEKEWMDKVLAEAEEVKVPDSLQPEAMEKVLQDRKQKKPGRSYLYGLAAACMVFVVGIAAYQTDQQQETVAPEKGNEKVKANVVATARDYDEVYEYIQAVQQERMESDEIYITENDARSLDSAAPEAAGSYSQTNLRQEGVDEGDYVKTDGTHLYVLKESTTEIAIADLQDQDMKVIGTIKLPKDFQAAEFYLADNQLIALGTENVTEYTSAEPTNAGRCIENTKAVTYDITNPSEPKEAGSFTQSGRYYSSRITGNYVYVLSQFYADTQSEKGNVDAYIPQIQGKSIAESSIYMPYGSQGEMYTVITSAALNAPGEIVDSKAVFSQGNALYVSGEHVYLYENIYHGDTTHTQTAIRKIAYQDGKLNAVGQTKIDGVINDSFSLDEYEGKLRVVTTVSYTPRYPQPRLFDSDSSGGVMPLNEDTASSEGFVSSETAIRQKDSNSLYVLDEDLNVIGSITNLAKDERVYSARFQGDTGYFVTYRQTDPLFSVDLSDPQNPKIIGQLKIPGFSEYLHPYKEGLLLGIGQDMDAEGVASDGVKVSMFDIKDPTNVKEIHKYVLEGTYSSDAFHDYKGVLIDSDKNRIGFSAYGDEEIYHLLSYEEDQGFTCSMKEIVSGHSYRPTRGIYINDILYVIKGNIIESYDLKTYEKTGDLMIK